MWKTIVLLIASGLIACSIGPTPSVSVTLPSGDAAIVSGPRMMAFAQEGRVALFEYRTSLDTRDKVALRAEADVIWAAVDKAVRLDNSIGTAVVEATESHTRPTGELQAVRFIFKK